MDINYNKIADIIVSQLFDDISDRAGLGDEFNCLDKDIKNEIREEWIKIIKEVNKKTKLYISPIEELDLSVASYHYLKRAGINSIQELKELSNEELLKIKNISSKRLVEIKEKLKHINCDFML